MSRSIDLFIRSSKPVEEVVSDLARLTELSLVPGRERGTWQLDGSDVHAELRTHPYVDDGELVLERYRYALSARVDHGTRLADSKEANLLRLVSDKLRQGDIDSLLVHDLQYREGGGRPPHDEPGEAS